METVTNMEIAKTIIEQIKFADKWALGCYGAKNLVALPECKTYAGGLRFKCSGYNSKVKFATVQLKWIDVYVISFLDKNGALIKSVENIYCDQLVKILDFIENR